MSRLLCLNDRLSMILFGIVTKRVIYKQRTIIDQSSLLNAFSTSFNGFPTEPDGYFTTNIAESVGAISVVETGLDII